MSDLRDQINSLSVTEKAELLDMLWESLEADSASLTDAQRAELDYRIARHVQNPSAVTPWQQVRLLENRPTLEELRDQLHAREAVMLPLDTACLVREEREPR
jgi:putative addiction module component (TIGR02574 family)